MSEESVRAHFTARAERYDRSSTWCTNDELGELVLRVTEPGAEDHVLDVACGTGLVSRLFVGKVARIVGADITRAMYEQAAPYLDELLVCPGEELAVPDDAYDIVVCRQGIQFMDDGKTVAEMVRAVKPGGRVCLIHLCAYGDEDKDTYFDILRLRNPVRRNFYLREELVALLRDAGCKEVSLHEHVSVEDVDTWSDNQAIPESNREAIRELYRNASSAFRDLHSVELNDGRFVDHMLFGVAVGVK